MEQVSVSRVDLDEVEADGLASLHGVQERLLEVVDVFERGFLGVRVLFVVKRDLGRADDCVSASRLVCTGQGQDERTSLDPAVVGVVGHGTAGPTVLSRQSLHPRRERRCLASGVSQLDTNGALVSVHVVHLSLQRRDLRVGPQSLAVSSIQVPR